MRGTFAYGVPRRVGPPRKIGSIDKLLRRSRVGYRYRWYNGYRLPDRYEHQTITVRLHGNDEDRARKLNRTENLRAIPPGDADFERLFPRRNDAESINRHVDDTMWLGRAHSIGHTRQHLNLIGFALCVNSLLLHRRRRKRPEELAA